MDSGNNLYIARFSNGVLKPQHGDSVKFGTFEQKATPQDRKKRKRMLVAETGQQTYIGQNYGAFTSASSDSCRYMVGIVDKKTGEMTVHATEILNMKPYRGDEAEEDEKKEMSYIEKSDMLTAAFGSSKKKRAMDSRHKNKLSADTLKDAVDTAVDKTLIRTDVDQVLKVNTAETKSDDLPPHNKDATTAAEAYPLSGIISDAEIEALRSAAATFVSCTKDNIVEWQQQQKYPSVVLRHLRVLPIKEKARLHRSCMLMHLSFMIHLYKLKAVDLKKRDLFPNMHIPNLVEKALLKKFTLQLEGSRVKTMPARLKDKLVCYILVLCLILDEFNMDYMSLLEDLRLSRPKAVNFLRALGCQISSTKKEFGGEASTSSFATLPTPLKFPELRQKKTKGGNR